MLTAADDFAEGGYTYKDLVSAGLIRSRMDLHLKQRKHGFPKPIKLSTRTAWFPKSEVHRWLKQRAALRDTNPKT
jgi:predicted DNA-binding transcriptional regulator AlpA